MSRGTEALRLLAERLRGGEPGCDVILKTHDASGTANAVRFLRRLREVEALAAIPVGASLPPLPAPLLARVCPRGLWELAPASRGGPRRQAHISARRICPVLVAAQIWPPPPALAPSWPAGAPAASAGRGAGWAAAPAQPPRRPHVAAGCRRRALPTRRLIRPSPRPLPPAVVTSNEDGRDAVAKCLSSGAADYWVRPLRASEARVLWTRLWRQQASVAALSLCLAVPCKACGCCSPAWWLYRLLVRQVAALMPRGAANPQAQPPTACCPTPPLTAAEAAEGFATRGRHRQRQRQRYQHGCRRHVSAAPLWEGARGVAVVRMLPRHTLPSPSCMLNCKPRSTLRRSMLEETEQPTSKEGSAPNGGRTGGSSGGSGGQDAAAGRPTPMDTTGDGSSREPAKAGGGGGGDPANGSHGGWDRAGWWRAVGLAAATPAPKGYNSLPLVQQGWRHPGRPAAVWAAGPGCSSG